MSVALGFGLNGKSIYMNVAKPMVVECSFSVDSTNASGLTSLKSNGYIQQIYMHSSAPSATNPNPANGIMQVQFKNNFNKFLGVDASVVSASQTSTKIDNSALVVGQVYVISTLGNATLAKWQAIGVPVGVTPAVGVAFIALTDGGAGNVLTSRVMVPNVSGIACVEVFGNSDVMTSANIAANNGQYLFAQFLAPSFTGSALASHNHNLIIKGGQIPSTTNDVATYAGPVLGKEEAADVTILGANSAASGGVVGASAGTPAGTMSLIPAAPVDGSIVKLAFWFDGSTVTVDGL
jgi:hypothetical protein